VRQKGTTDLKIADLVKDRALIDLARDAVATLVDDAPGSNLVNHPDLEDEIRIFLSEEDQDYLFKS
jgi:RecG-like helicase